MRGSEAPTIRPLIDDSDGYRARFHPAHGRALGRIPREPAFEHAKIAAALPTSTPDFFVWDLPTLGMMKDSNLAELAAAQVQFCTVFPGSGVQV